MLVSADTSIAQVHAPKNGNDGSPYAIALSFRGETKYDFQVYVEAIYRIKACRTHVFGMTEGQ